MACKFHRACLPQGFPQALRILPRSSDVRAYRRKRPGLSANRPTQKGRHLVAASGAPKPGIMLLRFGRGGAAGLAAGVERGSLACRCRAVLAGFAALVARRQEQARPTERCKRPQSALVMSMPGRRTTSGPCGHGLRGIEQQPIAIVCHVLVDHGRHLLQDALRNLILLLLKFVLRIFRRTLQALLSWSRSTSPGLRGPLDSSCRPGL